MAMFTSTSLRPRSVMALCHIGVCLNASRDSCAQRNSMGHKHISKTTPRKNVRKQGKNRKILAKKMEKGGKTTLKLAETWQNLAQTRCPNFSVFPCRLFSRIGE